MFINCPFCKALVATNPATDQPPEHCPRCAAKLHGVTADAPVPAVSPAPQDGQAGIPALDPNFLLQVPRSEEHTSELQSLMRISYAVFCLKKKTNNNQRNAKNKSITRLLN